MKIGIMSDTHGYWDPKFAFYLAECDEIWHAGDIGDYDTLQRIQGIGPLVRAVRGNVDFGDVRRECPEHTTFTTGGCTVFMTHIGGYPGRYAPGIKSILTETKANIFISGHSHILKIMPDNDLQLLHINPGACGRQGWHTQRTLVRLSIENSQPCEVETIVLS